MEIKALAFDLDGTLLGPGAVLTERTLNAVKSCAKKGIQIILATGRAVEASEQYRIPLGVSGPHVYFNGAIIAEMPERKILHAALLEKKIAEFCVDLSREKRIYLQAFIPGNSKEKGQPLLAERESREREMYDNHTGILAKIVDLKEVLKKGETQGCIKCMFIAEPAILDQIRPIINERFGNKVYLVKSTDHFLEILNPGVSKGQGLLLALEKLGIDPNETIAFGDEENDLPMFKAAGFSVAPANARETVISGANLTIGSNTEDGVAAFLEETFL